MYMICSMEESIARKVHGSVNRHGRKFARRSKFLASCADPNFNVIAHTFCPRGTKMSTLSQFNGLSCFQIAHQPECKSLFVEIERQGKNYVRSITTHQIAINIGNVYKETVPRRSSQGRPTAAAAIGMVTTTATVTVGRTNEDFITPRSKKRKSTRSKRTPDEMQTTPLKQRLRRKIIRRR